MPNPPNPPNRPLRPRLALLLPTVVLAITACGGAATAPSLSPTAGPTGTPRPTPTAVPGDPGTGVGGGGTDPGTGTGGGGTGGNPGAGIPGGIVFPDPGDPLANPLFGQANYLLPSDDLINAHPINVQLVRALQREDGSVVADLRWYSGVAPCSLLDHVEIVKDESARTIRFTVIEGSGTGDVACIDIAQLNATTVDLGKLPAGDWKLSAEGDAPEITLTVQ